MSRFATGILSAILVLAADQASKAWILYGLDLRSIGSVPVFPGLNFTMVWNTGVTFGLFGSAGVAGAWIFAAIALCVVIALGLWLRRAESLLVAIGLGAVAGGAVGNVIDRLRFGAVVDFIHAYVGSYSWYVFNIADAAIVCGVAALVLDSLRTRR